MKIHFYLLELLTSYREVTDHFCTFVSNYSLKDFVCDAGEFATRIVDGLLNILTGNEHSKTNKIFEEVNYLK